MNKKIVYVGPDFDEAQYHGAALKVVQKMVVELWIVVAGSRSAFG